jgi:hypothetical protein
VESPADEIGDKRGACEAVNNDTFTSVGVEEVAVGCGGNDMLGSGRKCS